MSNEECYNEKPYNYTPYYCHLCKIYCASPINLQTHFLGMKHKSVENALKTHGIVKPLSSSGEPIKPLESLPDYVQTESEKALGRTLAEQLNLCQDSEPAIGLQYITEHRSSEYPVYACSLCGCQTGLSNMFMHVLGVRHRWAYLKKHYPEMSDVTGKGANLNRKLKELAAKIEEKEGREEIKVTKDPPAPKDRGYTAQLPYSLVTWFAEDDVEMKKEKDTNKENPTLEKNEIANKVEEASKDAEVKTQCDNSNRSEKSEKQQDQNTDQKKVVLKDYDESEEFADNEELLKYLDEDSIVTAMVAKFLASAISLKKRFKQLDQGFEILNESDASFILKIIQKLTNALVMYRYISEKKNAFKPNREERFDQNAFEPNPEERFDQFSFNSEETDGLYIDFSDDQLHIQRSCNNEGANLKAKSTFKRKASHLNTDPSKDNAKSFKLGTFVSTFKEVPNEQNSDDDTQDADAKMQESPSQKAAPSTIADSKDLSSSEKHLSDPTSDKKSSSQNQSAASSSVCPGPSTSDNMIAEFFNSIRNMEVHEVAATLHKIAVSNPAFRGMDVQNVITILKKSGNLKPEDTSSAQ